MTLEQAKQLKEGQEIWYKGLNDFPEKVVVSKLLYNQQGKLEIHLVDNCYIPERDLKEYVYTKRPNDTIVLNISRGKISKEISIILKKK